MNQDNFKAALQQVYRDNHFLRFDEFIVCKFCDVLVGSNITEEMRKTAFGQFQKRTDQADIASAVTMRRWFGLSGYAKPNRMHIYEMAFALHLDKEETEEYLTRGIGESSFQISDYHEIIYLYGIENQLSFEKCQQMIHLFEKNLMVNQRLSTTRSTEQLRQQYEEKKSLPIPEFLLFMADNTMYFKGYSNTALSYLLTYRDQVLKYIRKDAKRKLDYWLAETDYAVWRRRRWSMEKKDSYQMIQKYLKSHQGSRLSDETVDNIKELSKIAYSTLSNNSLVHSELFCGQTESDLKTTHTSVRNMSMKHISDLFNVADHKENAIQVIAALGQLELLREEEECPIEVKNLLKKLTKREQVNWNCGKAREWLLEYEKEHKRRQLVVQRSDLLPFVLYVSQQRYQEQMEDNGTGYDMTSARAMFRQAADDVLIACNMAPISEEWELDAVLLACYQKQEMYGYADALERLYG